VLGNLAPASSPVKNRRPRRAARLVGAVALVALLLTGCLQGARYLGHRWQKGFVVSYLPHQTEPGENLRVRASDLDGVALSLYAIDGKEDGKQFGPFSIDVETSRSSAGSVEIPNSLPDGEYTVRFSHRLLRSMPWVLTHEWDKVEPGFDRLEVGDRRGSGLVKVLWRAGPQTNINNICATRDGHFLGATGTFRELAILDLRTGRVRQVELPGSNRGVEANTDSQGDFVVLSLFPAPKEPFKTLARFLLVQPSTGRYRELSLPLQEGVATFAVSQPGTEIAIGTPSGKVETYDLRTKRLIRTSLFGSVAASNMFYGDNGKFLVASTRDRVAAYSAASLKKIWERTSINGAFAVSGNSPIIAYVEADTTVDGAKVRVLSLNSPNLNFGFEDPYSFQSWDQPISCLWLSPSGDRLLASFTDQSTALASITLQAGGSIGLKETNQPRAGFTGLANIFTAASALGGHDFSRAFAGCQDGTLCERNLSRKPQ
jgi:hypothetical protein